VIEPRGTRGARGRIKSVKFPSLPVVEYVPTFCGSIHFNLKSQRETNIIARDEAKRSPGNSPYIHQALKGRDNKRFLSELYHSPYTYQGHLPGATLRSIPDYYLAPFQGFKELL
jgi:hypothetical protein